MTATTPCEPSLEAGVAEFLKRHAAEGEFQTTYDIVRSCFPELRQIHASLQEDPDEDDRQRVIFEVILPPSHSLDLLQAQRRRFSEELVERLPPARFPDPVCGLMISFARET